MPEPAVIKESFDKDVTKPITNLANDGRKDAIIESSTNGYVM